MTNNILIVSNPSTEDVRAYLLAGHDGGTWSGDGIVSSLADSTNYGLGYATAAQLNAGGTYAGLPVVDSDTIVRYTRYGDANLDSLVNLNDFNALAANFGQGGRQWFQGDFNYDGLVNLNDFKRLAANFGLSASGPEVTPQDWSNLAAAVPEPAAMGLIAVAGPVLLRRRRRD